MPDQAIFLLVEDSEDDILLMQRAFLIANFMNPLQVVRTGEEAIDYLAGVGRFANRTEFPIPAIVLIDLKLPGKSGFEVLRWIRSQRRLRAVRIVVLTASNDIEDVSAAYKLGAHSFIRKPVAFERLVAAAVVLKGYWLRLDRSSEVIRFADAQPGSPAPQYLDKAEGDTRSSL